MGAALQPLQVALPLAVPSTKPRSLESPLPPPAHLRLPPLQGLYTAGPYICFSPLGLCVAYVCIGPAAMFCMAMRGFVDYYCYADIEYLLFSECDDDDDNSEGLRWPV